MKEKFYLTTAIAYTSGKPHIGNTYEAILSDSVYKLVHGIELYYDQKTIKKAIKTFIDKRSG